MKSNRQTARTIAWSLIAASALVACSKVPVTGRRQFNLLPDSLMENLGASTYQSMLSEATLSTGNDNAKTLQRVGNAIADASGSDGEGYAWEYKLIQENDTINAWALPGGKTAVYTGLLPVVQNEAGLAFVMGHEVGHATASHGAERMSQQLAVLGGMAGLYLYLDKKSDMSDDSKAMVVAALGLGAEVGIILPFSRSHEKEADIIGMMYMAKAGYPPTESTKVWDRMENATGGSSMPDWLSTHPSNENRKSNLSDWMGQAKKKYERSKQVDNSTRTLWTDSSSGSGKSSGGKNSGGKTANNGKSGGGKNANSGSKNDSGKSGGGKSDSGKSNSGSDRERTR